jgi:hypothetical protein
MTPETHLRIVGALVIALAALHAMFPRWFNWRDELSRLSLLNRQIFLVHTGFIVLVLAMTGAMSLLAPGDLITGGRPGVLISAGLAAFWAIRLLVQFFVYDPRLWRGSRARTALHILAATLSGYFAATYAWAAAA